MTAGLISNKDSGSSGDRRRGTQAVPAAKDATADGQGEGCDSLACLCGMLCDKVAAIACENDSPRDECEELCLTLDDDDACGEQGMVALRCRANLPLDAYTCSPRLKENMILGCTQEVDAYAACFGGP